MTYTQHPLSAAFPAMQPDEYQSLVDSIESIGVQNPITLLDGMVIDGWHRYQAATSLGMDCPTVALDDTDPRDFVMAQNKARRHITSAQLATATTAVYAWHPANRPNKSAVPAELPKSTKELAAIAGVGTRSIEQAKAIQKNASPEVKDAVKDGKIGLEKAVAISKMPMQQQAEAINKPLPKQEPANAQKIVPEPLALVEEYTELDAARDQIEGLQDALAVANIGSADPEEAAQAKNLIAELREENRKLRVNLKAVTTSRDSLMNELTMVKRQCVSLQAKIKKAA